MSRLPLLLVLALGLTACRPPADSLDATVELEKILPASSVATTRVVLYRVISPADIAGRYGIAPTHASQEVAQSHVGTLYRIRLGTKDREMLTRNKPDNALTSATEDFFDRAVPQKNK